MNKIQLTTFRLTLLLVFLTPYLSAQNPGAKLNMEDTVGVVVGSQLQDSLWQVGTPQNHILIVLLANQLQFLLIQ
jgi:hypothetical protein